MVPMGERGHVTGHYVFDTDRRFPFPTTNPNGTVDRVGTFVDAQLLLVDITWTSRINGRVGSYRVRRIATKIEMTPVPAGWATDPRGRHQYRCWDGKDWTDDMVDNGVVSVDRMPRPGTNRSGLPTTPLIPQELWHPTVNVVEAREVVFVLARTPGGNDAQIRGAIAWLLRLSDKPADHLQSLSMQRNDSSVFERP